MREVFVAQTSKKILDFEYLQQLFTHNSFMEETASDNSDKEKQEKGIQYLGNVGGYGVSVTGDGPIDWDKVYFSGEVSETQKEQIIESLKRKQTIKETESDELLITFTVNPNHIYSGELFEQLERIFS